jgi:hypothetical protein
MNYCEKRFDIKRPFPPAPITDKNVRFVTYVLSYNRTVGPIVADFERLQPLKISNDALH